MIKQFRLSAPVDKIFSFVPFGNLVKILSYLYIMIASFPGLVNEIYSRFGHLSNKNLCKPSLRKNILPKLRDPAALFCLQDFDVPVVGELCQDGADLVGGEGVAGLGEQDGDPVAAAVRVCFNQEKDFLLRLRKSRGILVGNIAYIRRQAVQRQFFPFVNTGKISNQIFHLLKIPRIIVRIQEPQQLCGEEILRMAYRPRKHTSKIETEKIRDLIFHVTQLWKLQRKSTEMVEKLWQELPGCRVAVQIF